jgi:hypothetical protein
MQNANEAGAAHVRVFGFAFCILHFALFFCHRQPPPSGTPSFPP